MKLPLALIAVLLSAIAANAATKDAPAKPKPCPKGQVATTSKVTGEQACFAMTMFAAPGQAAPMDTTAKSKPKPKSN